MARRAVKVVAAPGITLPHEWRADGFWRIQAMLAKIPPDDYLPTARAFEIHHIASGTVSTDWRAEWRSWCRDILVRRGQIAGRFDPAPEAVGLFG